MLFFICFLMRAAVAPTSFEGNSAGCGWDWEVGGGIGRLVVGLGGWGWDWEVLDGIPEVGGGKVPPTPPPPNLESQRLNNTWHLISYGFLQGSKWSLFNPQKVVQKRSLAQPSNIGNCNLLIEFLEWPFAFKFLTNIKSARSYI